MEHINPIIKKRRKTRRGRRTRDEMRTIPSGTMRSWRSRRHLMRMPWLSTRIIWETNCSSQIKLFLCSRDVGLLDYSKRTRVYCKHLSTKKMTSSTIRASTKIMLYQCSNAKRAPRFKWPRYRKKEIKKQSRNSWSRWPKYKSFLNSLTRWLTMNLKKTRKSGEMTNKAKSVVEERENEMTSTSWRPRKKLKRSEWSLRPRKQMGWPLSKDRDWGTRSQPNSRGSRESRSPCSWTMLLSPRTLNSSSLLGQSPRL